MVVMTFGTGDVSKTSQVVSAFFGYIIGMESALGSYVFGMTIATFIHRWRNPRNAQEADAARERAMEGVYLNHGLPEFERRYLPDLEMDHMEHTVHGVAFLERWRRSTRDARHVHHELLPALCEIENAMLINEQPFSQEAQGVAQNAGWDLEALSEWVKLNPRAAPEPPTSSLMFTIPVSVFLCVTLALPMLLGLIFVNDLEDAYQVTSRTMFYSACLAPFGALLRWNLSVFNGKLSGDLSWIPAGTLIANVSGSVISIVMIALELNMAADGFWTVGTLRAIKVGFCGCLTTVSSFVSEVNTLMRKKPNHYQAYLYILMSLLTSFVVASAVYAWIVYD
jgi:fluoride ion exporter CrcB/FEX